MRHRLTLAHATPWPMPKHVVHSSACECQKCMYNKAINKNKKKKKKYVRNTHTHNTQKLRAHAKRWTNEGIPHCIKLTIDSQVGRIPCKFFSPTSFFLLWLWLGLIVIEMSGNTENHTCHFVGDMPKRKIYTG